MNAPVAANHPGRAPRIRVHERFTDPSCGTRNASSAGPPQPRVGAPPDVSWLIRLRQEGVTSRAGLVWPGEPGAAAPCGCLMGSTMEGFIKLVAKRGVTVYGMASRKFDRPGLLSRRMASPSLCSRGPAKRFAAFLGSGSSGAYQVRISHEQREHRAEPVSGRPRSRELRRPRHQRPTRPVPRPGPLSGPAPRARGRSRPRLPPSG